jgi:hypothetical protein
VCEEFLTYLHDKLPKPPNLAIYECLVARIAHLIFVLIAKEKTMNIRKMTYRELFHALFEMTDEQLDCEVIIEDGSEKECYLADLRVLDDNSPVIYSDFLNFSRFE